MLIMLIMRNTHLKYETRDIVRILYPRRWQRVAVERIPTKSDTDDHGVQSESQVGHQGQALSLADHRRSIQAIAGLLGSDGRRHLDP